MAQIKIYARDTLLERCREKMSETIHEAAVDGLSLPADKKFHRFFPMRKEDFYYPAGRTENYTILEISIFEGRTVETKKKLIRLLFSLFQKNLGIQPEELEITIFETPKPNWGIRGLPGDELTLNYKVEV